MTRLALLPALLAGAALAASPAPPPRPGAPPEPERAEPAQPAPPPGVQFYGLDKYAASAAAFAATPDQPTAFGALLVTVRACHRTGEGDAAHVTIIDAEHPPAPIFSGWMFAESPGLNSLDHPRYDVWLASCSTVSTGAD